MPIKSPRRKNPHFFQLGRYIYHAKRLIRLGNTSFSREAVHALDKSRIGSSDQILTQDHKVDTCTRFVQLRLKQQSKQANCRVKTNRCKKLRKSTCVRSISIRTAPAMNQLPSSDRMNMSDGWSANSPAWFKRDHRRSDKMCM